MIAHPLALVSRPAPLVATLVLLCNDHVLKGAGLLPGLVTGKLSDLAGLFLVPILGTACVLWLARAAGRRWRGMVVPTLCALSTALFFTALKLWPGFNHLLARVWGMNRLDPSDLLALPMVALAWLWLARELPGRSPDLERETSADKRPMARVTRPLVAALAAIACVATSPPMYPRNYPMWHVRESGYRPHGCADVAATVSKSGKAGVGLTLVVRGNGHESCRVTVERAVLRLEPSEGSPRLPVEMLVVTALAGDGQVFAADITGGQVAYIYLPFAFDNNTMWNQHVRRGVFELDLTSDGNPSSWSIPAEHRLDGFHRSRTRYLHEPPPQPAPIKSIAE